MIAPLELPPEFYAWNRRHHAPFGRRNWLSRFLGDRYPGPFAFQANSGTRVYEYPWAHAAVNAHRVARGGRPLTIVELGGVQGNPKELHGYPEFTPEHVLAGLAGYLVGQPYPALAQCLIARRVL